MNGGGIVEILETKVWWSSPTTPTSMIECMCNPQRHIDHIQCLKFTVTFKKNSHVDA